MRIKKLLLTNGILGAFALAVHYVAGSLFHFSTDWLWAFYSFFVTFSIFSSLYCSVTFRKNPERIGLVFMSLIVVKILLFAVAFSPFLIGYFDLNNSIKINLMIPFILFLSLEVRAIVNLIKSAN
jgi:hypothetical protein